jgi:deoxyribonuclease V
VKYRNLHPWKVSPKEAVQIQRELRSSLLIENDFSDVHLIAGADIALDKRTSKGYAGVIIYTFPELDEVERRHAMVDLTFPYIPGLLGFREAPALLKAFAAVRHVPDIVIFDGQGIAHPRRMGIATHMGIVLDKPSIGCAKSRLIGTFEEPGPRAGHHTPLSDAGEVIGAVLRTRDNVKPVFISPGYKVDVATSVEIMMQCADGFRIPKPTREADRFVAEVKRTSQTPRN